MGLALALVMSAAQASLAQIGWEVSTDLKSKYVAPGLGFVADQGPVAQMGITASLSNGLYVNVWGSKSLTDRSRQLNFGDELNYTLGWGCTLAGFGVAASVSYFDLAPLVRSKNDMVQFALEVNRSFVLGEHMLTPYVALKPMIAISKSDGLRIEGGLRHRWLFSEQIAITQGGRVLCDTGTGGVERGCNFRYDAALSWKVSGTVRVDFPTIQLFQPITHFSDDDGRKREWLVGTRLTVVFPAR